MDVFMGALIDILAIIGIIVAGGFIVFFLGDILLSILDPKKEEPKDRTVKGTTLTYEEIEIRERKLKEERAKFEEEKKNATAAPQTLEQFEKKEEKVDYWKAAEEEKQLKPAEEAKSYDKIKQEEEEYRKQRLQAIEERRLALMRELEEDEEEEEEEDEDSVDLDNLDFGEEYKEEEKEEEVVETKQKEPVVVEKFIEKVVVDHEEADSLREEIERLKREMSAEKMRNDTLARQAAEAKAEAEDAKLEVKETKMASATVFNGPALSKDEYEAMFITYTDRLELIKRQLKKVDKEYLPLARVWRTFARDEAKLNRKEAQVAKQKVVLYGVNNYADIDEEKAKKLAEDLDLLDGLKLSVAHCKEVMEKNKDKFPILENTHNILKQTIENIKGDIAKVEIAIKKITKTEN